MTRIYTDQLDLGEIKSKINLQKYLTGIIGIVLLSLPQIINAQELENDTHPPTKDIFVVVEDVPTFQGCEDESTKQEKKQCADKKILDYIYAHLKYPKIAIENKIEGTVVIRFYIDKEGRINEPLLVKDIGAGCGKEVIRVVESIPNTIKKSTLGKSRGKPVQVYFNLPVEFDLSNFQRK